MYNPEIFTKKIVKKEHKIENNLNTIENSSEDKELSENLIYLLGDLRYLKNKFNNEQNSDEYKRRLADTVENFSNFLINNNAQLKDVSEVYRQYLSKNNKTLIVRREDPEKVAKLIENHDIDLSFDPKVVGDKGDKYANCAIWPYGKNQTTGIRNAFLEGRGMAGPLVTMIATKQNNNHNQLDELGLSELKVGDIDRESIRIVSGKIKKEDLEFIVLRLQKQFCPASVMTEKEKQSETKEIFRAFQF